MGELHAGIGQRQQEERRGYQHGGRRDGGADRDTIYGGTGNDMLNGGAGNDTYLFGRGSGKDTISTYDDTVGKIDTVQLGAGVDLAKART